MRMNDLTKTAQQLVNPKKGILAADESFPTIEKRLKSIEIESTEENRRAYRELLFTTSGIEDFISGVILFDETIKHKTKDGVPFPKVLADKGIIPGIKVDQGKEKIKGEFITKGIEGLSDRLKEYFKLGARFTKWRAVYEILDSTPSDNAINKNAELLAEFALISQKSGFVPIVEAEVLMDGSHGIEKCGEVTKKVLSSVFSELEKKGVDLNGILLKPNMIVPGKESKEKMEPEKVAVETIKTFKRVLPEELLGVVFLSGGQTPDKATANLNAINKKDECPWELSFSFGRALQKETLEAWKGREENAKMAQDLFLKRAKLVSLARQGKYK